MESYVPFLEAVMKNDILDTNSGMLAIWNGAVRELSREVDSVADGFLETPKHLLALFLPS